MDLTIRDILGVLAKKWWIIAICTLVGAGASLAYSVLLIKPVYKAEATFYVTYTSQLSSQSTYQDSQYAQDLVNEYIVVLTSDPFLENVRQASELSYSAEAIKKMLELGPVEVNNNATKFFKVTVTCPNQTDALSIARSIMDLAPDEIIRVMDAGSVKLLSADPLVKQAGSSFGPVQLTLLGALALLVISAVVVVLTDIFDFRIKGPDDIEKHYNIPLLGSVPNIKNV